MIAYEIPEGSQALLLVFKDRLADNGMPRHPVVTVAGADMAQGQSAQGCEACWMQRVADGIASRRAGAIGWWHRSHSP